ncbi:hypothetical protein KSD_59120 [Ktedonobacter sp. SOSP1-85]|uniref:hypothetical protein n=1 Tax=Ktedonobacter sp. SOSP1-85 TaxID=2778367 RepID=UPI00191558CF|nr:hypothetical protein [Ktedonobacter sp. SOSP1-85]GHO78141.1 hypothetical protein KSD_59120 [Ktedonobacter sp. SOSP1-85]
MHIGKFYLPKKILFWLVLLSIFATSATVVAASPAQERVASIRSNGVELALHVPNEPIFLSELLPVDVSLTNENSQPVTFMGDINSTLFCKAALKLSIKGGGEPHFQLPHEQNGVTHGCGAFGEVTVQPHQTVTAHYFLPMTASGAVTLQASASLASRSGDIVSTNDAFIHHTPTLALNVSPQIPAERRLSLRLSGSHIFVSAPSPARAHLYYQAFGECQYGDGSSIHRILEWITLPDPALNVPDCARDTSRTVTGLDWGVSVGSPGYAIATLNK